jgi:hypothetical protein
MNLRAVLVLILLLFVSAPLCAQQNGEVIGRVVSSRDNESLALVQIELQGTMLKAVTDDEGKFRLANVPAGSYVLQAASVGYYVLREPFMLMAGESKNFDIVLAASNSTITNSVDVKADPFQLNADNDVTGFTLEGNERKNLASVLADDPLRAVQGLPGVTSNNDFSSEFSVRGAPFNRVGLYLDGILLHAPVHTTDGKADNGSLTIFNGDLTQDMTLFQGAWPVRYSDRTAGIVAVENRDGSREYVQGQASASGSNASIVFEGPFSAKKRGSWVASFRKSYLQYILNRIDFGDQAPIAFGFTDGQARASYDLSSKHTVSITYLDGTSNVDRSRFHDELGPNTLMTSDFRFTFVEAGSRYTPNDRVLIANHVAWEREAGDTQNRDRAAMSDGHYAEWVWHSDDSVMWRKHSTLEFGAQFRHVSEHGSEHDLVYTPDLVSALDTFTGTTNEKGGYVQESIDVASSRLHITAGVRADTRGGETVTSPHVSLALEPWKSARLELSWGQYSQLPEINQVFSSYSNGKLLPERATHYQAALEERVNDRIRVRLEMYDRQDRDILARPALFPRLLADGSVFQAVPNAPWLNSERGYARGFEIFVQRRSANGFTGWISYAYGHAVLSDGFYRLKFPSDYDQHNTVNGYVSRRLRPTVNVSARVSYGTGMPLPGFYQLVSDGYAIARERNALRAPVYQRTDLRLNKDYVHTKIKTTVYGEIVNLTNHRNSDFDTPGTYDTGSRRTFPTFYSMFPILPSAGVVFEF